MRFKKISAILIWSEDYISLSNWYIDKLEAVVTEKLNHPEDTGVSMHIGESYLWVGKHSLVKGKNKDPYRIMFNITVDSVTDTYKELIKKEVEFVAKPFKAPTFDKYFATFKDLDGNILQLIGNK